MKKLSIVCVSLLLGGIVVFDSCTKTGPQGPAGPDGPTGPGGPSLSGTLTGHIDLYDEYGGQQYGNASAAKAYLYNATGTTVLDSTNADSAGIYTINNISTGDYTMLFTAPGYGYLERIPFQFVGGGTVYSDAKLSQIPDFFVSSVNADSINHITSNIIINCTLSSSSAKARELLVFIGSTSSVSSNPAIYLSVFPVTVGLNTTTVVIKIPLTEVYNSILVSGSVPYFAIYGATNGYNESSEYEDVNSGKIIYTALNATVFNTTPAEPLP